MQAPGLLHKQGTLMIYGAGHKDKDIGILGPVLFLEPTLLTSVGASGGFDQDGRPTTYRRASELISGGTIQVMPLVTHRYTSLETIHMAFDADFRHDNYIKGMLNLG